MSTTYIRVLQKLFPADVIVKKEVAERMVQVLMTEEHTGTHITSFAISCEHTSPDYRHIWLSHSSVSRLFRAQNLLDEFPGLDALLMGLPELRKKRS